MVMQIVDESASRKDLAVRRETKYILTGADIGKVRRLLEGNSRRQVHNEEVSVVRSIYFDDVRLSACRANLDGLGLRRKVRLRWYDRPLPTHDCYLEIKWRNNKVTGKHRLHIRSPQEVGNMTYHQLNELLLRHVPQEYTIDLLRYSEPVVIVEYKREHFTSRDGKLRVTIDYDLAFYSQQGKPSPSIAFAHHMPGFIVVEGKTPLGCERELRTMLAPLSLRAGKCSKYVHGCRAVGIISDRD